MFEVADVLKLKMGAFLVCFWLRAYGSWSFVVRL